MRLIPLFIFVCSVLLGQSQPYTVESVPNTKLINNSYVSNPDRLLTEATASEINSILGSLEQQSSAQVAVVAINSIGEADIFDFAQKLFIHWGIGKAKEDNGLLILLVMDKRTIRLHTGYGLEGILPDIVCKHIEREKMLPHFKQQDYDSGMLEGVREVAKIVGDVQYGKTLQQGLISTNQESKADSETQNGDSLWKIVSDIDITEFLIWAAIIWMVVMLIVFFYKRNKGLFVDAPKYSPTQNLHIKTSGRHFIFWFLVLPVGIMLGMIFVNRLWTFVGAFYGYITFGAIETRMRLDSVYNKWIKEKSYYALHQLYQEKLSFWILAAVALPIPFAFLIGPYKKKMRFLRDHPRDCTQCNQPASKLSDQAEDPFLNKNQQFEETLKSVDYDVWKCNSCSASQVFRYPNRQSHYEDCPKCATVAYYIASTKTLRSATESSEGQKEETKICRFCQFKNVRTFAIPKLSSSSSSGGSGSGSSGGSWGGGSSGGGGASSSW